VCERLLDRIFDYAMGAKEWLLVGDLTLPQTRPHFNGAILSSGAVLVCSLAPRMQELL